jgi:chorismate mutase/prephenate dehydrogenase
VGELKRRENLPTVDYTQERVVLDRARSYASECGIEPSLVEDLFTLLIRSAVMAQDEDRLRVAAAGAGKHAVVVGGEGRMGMWLRRFLSAQGYGTSSLDPAADEDEKQRADRALPSADLVVCSTPPLATAQIYAQWLYRPPAGVVVDIASIKTPLIEPIRALQRAGARVASLHPLFGPSTILLRGADVVICDTGDPEAALVVEKLFQPTTARIVRLPLDEHDRIMADLLSLSHAAAIAVALALPDEEHPVSSTTFRALKSLAGSVVRESSEVYYEIQALNPYSAKSLQRLSSAVARIIDVLSARDPDAFQELLREGQRHTTR